MRLFPCKAPGRLVVVLALLLALGTAGCKRPTASITGKVYYKNKLVKGGNVTFISADKGTSQSSRIEADGSYTISRMPVGEVKIGVETRSMKQAASRPRYSAPSGQTMPGNNTPDPKEVARLYVEIPESYADPDKSGQTYTVKNGNQEHDIKLP